MANSESHARRWTRFIANRPEFGPGRLLIDQFDAGSITSLCDCGCNSFEFKATRAANIAPLVPPGRGLRHVFSISFETQEPFEGEYEGVARRYEKGTVSFYVFVDGEGYLSAIDVDFCANSFPMPEDPKLEDPPWDVAGMLANAT